MRRDSRWEWGQCTVQLRCARTATTDIIRMHARLTGTTGLAGSLVESSSEQVRGSAADSVADLVDVDLIADSADVDSIVDSADAVSRDMERLVADSGAEPDAVVAFTAAVAVASMAEAVRTVEAVTAAVDTGKIQQ